MENLVTAKDEVSLTAGDLAEIDERMASMKKMAELYCTGCGYCMPCPSEIGIASIFDKYNRGRVYGLWESARAAYAQIGQVAWEKGNKADACTECGECEDKCPQNIPIRKQLAEAHAALAGDCCNSDCCNK